MMRDFFFRDFFDGEKLDAFGDLPGDGDLFSGCSGESTMIGKSIWNRCGEKKYGLKQIQELIIVSIQWLGGS
jgi:hypothetical protein